MSQSPKIVLFHVHKDAMNAAVAAFEQDWPEARISNIVEDGLFDWVRETGGVVPEMYDAFQLLTGYAIDRGADGILYSCSAFRECIDACIETFDRPMLKPNEAMIEAALETGSRIAVIATVAPTIVSISAEIEEMARATGRQVELTPHFVEGAFDAMAAGDGEVHDRLVADVAAGIIDADAIMLAQFTLARAAPAVEAVTGIPVFNSPGAAVVKMRELLAD
ncbi:MAG: arylsulfatase [Alphaproteobacteria bacterium]|nr:arylsulfatase [Alphaproteobacteria bacterium]|tara:strand:- start:252 stop:914 length:663 start_codon:yes stop_codon:yes gene_type:complete